MILTVTPNPSIDLLFETDRLVWDDANRVEMPRRRAGGQGVNLTRAVRELGGESVAIALLGGSAGVELQSLLSEDQTPCIAVPISGETRVFVAVRENATGKSLLINPRGPVLTQDERARVVSAVADACASLVPTWMICSGSIPRGLGSDVYGVIGRIARQQSSRFVADCDGEALEHAITAGCNLIAPNQHEAARLLGVPVDTVQDAARAARSLLSRAPRVLIKLGEEGAVLADSQGCWHAQGPRIMRGSAVGAGDAFLAAFIVADNCGAKPQEALRRAVAAGSAVLLGSGSKLLSRSDYESMMPDVGVTAV